MLIWSEESLGNVGWARLGFQMGTGFKWLGSLGFRVLIVRDFGEIGLEL